MRDVQRDNTPPLHSGKAVTGAIVERKGEPFYRIGQYDRMPPFFISVVSGYDHWMYVSSTGGITCGRRNPGHALFPYETDDRIHDACHTAGPQTILRVDRNGVTRLWEPFLQHAGTYRVERNLYKSLAGNRLAFEEINHDLGLAFEYEWSTGHCFGFIRHAALTNLLDNDVRIGLFDGMRNLLPCGVDPNMQATRSTLLNAYRQAEVDPQTGTGIYTLSSIPTDRAEPSEALKASCAWNAGLDAPTVLLSGDQAGAFRAGETPSPETSRRGQRCDYFVHAELEIAGGRGTNWFLLADVNQGPATLVALLERINQGDGNLRDGIDEDIADGTHRLQRRANASDAFQCTADNLACARHYSNALFNIMRGGVFQDSYRVPAEDFLAFVKTWNTQLTGPFQALLARVDRPLERSDLVRAARESGDPHMERLALEYLPLTFSRRHGDPSRPWNAFDIDVSYSDGTEKFAYQGNWRDIFQNWEALSLSFPDYLEDFIAKFVNGSTADGYNPYRITQDGLDWEILDPDDPWSNIGYWGDHQVAYLLKLLERERDCYPGRLAGRLDRKLFVHADVPYRIKGYAAMLDDPRDTVEFDTAAQAAVEERVRRIGSDGRLSVLADGSIVRVTLLEKLLLAALVRIGNFVPGGGIWMNTQRPEWNDANNALVGYGLSMVTLCYLRRYLALLGELLEEHGAPKYRISVELLRFFDDAFGVLEHRDTTDAARDDYRRKTFMDRMGAVAEDYRESVYAGLSGRTGSLSSARLLAFTRRALYLLDDSIAANRRRDGLYHAYNLLRLDRDGHAVERLPEMLEGQVAVLSAGVLKPAECVSVLDSLRRSRMFRADQESYTLYPFDLPAGFLERNLISEDRVASSEWIRAELETGRHTFVERDVRGNVHFNGRFRNADELRNALEREQGISGDEADGICSLFESVFDHRRFTGRSGAMYKYEGLGCIYWHMVSKLLLAVGENIGQTTQSDERLRLLEHYDSIKSGLGAHKSPAAYGAFPFDPYSHTPAFAGVQQPGMTGQVKEDLISRFAELGVTVRSGKAHFMPRYLKRSEFFGTARAWTVPGSGDRTVELPADSLAFTLCGIPVVYRLGTSGSLRLYRQNEEPLSFDTPALDREWSRRLFSRDPAILRIEVEVDPGQLR